MMIVHFRWSTWMLYMTILIGFFLAVTVSSGQEKKETASQVVLPKKVMEALNIKFPKALIDKQSLEKEDDRKVYDIEFTQEGVKYEVDIFADGTIYNWEKAITADELPAAVTMAIEKKYPKATLKEIMAITETKEGNESLEGYEIVLLAADKKEHEVTVAPDGKILEESGEEK
jgi:uncharacterized membrane protein YkoI